MTDNNPYRSPSSDVNATSGAGYELQAPRQLPAGQGLQWISGGIAHLVRDSAMWFLTMLVGFVIMIFLMVIPLIGQLASVLTTFVWTGGLMIGCRAQADGRPFEVGYLFAGFKDHAGKLMLLSLLNSIAGALLFVMIFGSFWLQIAQSTDPTAANLEELFDPAGIGLRLLFAMLLTVPLAMAFWFAPVLIVMHNVSVTEALRLSFIGCAMNWLPFLLYGLIMGIPFVLAMVDYFLIFVVPGWAMFGIVLLGLMLIAGVPILLGSIFVAYRDIFLRRADAP